ncbi:hypothetical protein OKW30_006529 [Paraburkholderia sp. Clong3]|uniref:hypothetical protein n=1 Tax=Paraburkholderia sp. Clong3 TaxID=2991061 RepID=UPI003D1C8372
MQDSIPLLLPDYDQLFVIPASHRTMPRPARLVAHSSISISWNAGFSVTIHHGI